MSEDARSSVSRARRPLRVINRGPDSDDSGEDSKLGQYTVYPNPASQAHYHIGATTYSPSILQPSRLSTNLLGENSPNYQSSSRSNPTLSSPSSTSSHAVESTPPPTTPSLSTPPADDQPSSQESSVTPSSGDRIDSTHARPSNTLKAPYHHHRNGIPLPRPPANPSPTFRPIPSPTTSIPEQYISPTTSASASSPDKLLIVVTADSERYLTVDITGAKNPAFIRERIFGKLCVWEEEHQSKFSIYQTEIGAFAIGDALTDERLYDLCQERGDSRGSLKFLVSHSSAPVHEEPPRSSSSVSPTVTTIPPPVLPYDSSNYGALRPNRRSESRPSSVSSASEHLPEVSAGYEASVSDDFDNADRDRPTIRRPPQHVGNVPNSPHNNRKPSAQMPRPVSPITSFRPTSPPPTQVQDRARNEVPLRDKYGNIVPTPPPPPPLSPTRQNFPVQDDNPPLLPPTRIPHIRTGSDPAAEREQALRASENQMEYAQRQWQRHRQMEERAKSDRPRDGPVVSRPDDEPGKLGRSDSWVMINRDGVPRRDQLPTSQEGTRSSPLHRTRHFSPNKPPSSFPPGLRIPHPPTKPPPTPPVTSNEPRNSPHQAGQPVPSHWIDRSKSLGNLKAAFNSHPAGLQPGVRRNPGQLPMTRINGGSTGLHLLGDGCSRRDPSASTTNLAKSYEAQRAPMRPSPLPHLSQEFSQWSQSAFGLSFTSPSRDPYPRPRSALGDPLSPSEIIRSPRTASPTRRHLPGNVGGRSNTAAPRSSDAYGTDSRPPLPQSPASPRDLKLTLPRERLPEVPSSNPVNSTISSNQERDESTLRPEDLHWIVRMWDGQPSGEIGTVTTPNVPDRGTPPSSAPKLPSIPSASDISSSTLIALPDDETDSDDDVGTAIWKKRPEERPRPLSIMRSPHRGPPLKVRIDPNANRPSVPVSNNVTASPPLPPPPASRPAPSRPKGGPGVRGSTFTDMRDYTWAPRPPPEDVYERLEEFFPNHDLDKPVIEASSGGTSPTAPDHTVIPLPPVNDKSRVKSKKSIRIVAEEHKKRIDRTSRADASSISSAVMRKRSTKLWGSRLEEVTTAKAGLAAALPESPSGGPKPIFKWVRGELIGKGTYGRVYLALNATTGEMIAVKQVEMPRTASDKSDSRQVTVVQALKMESETLKDLDHPNIVQYLGFEETPNFLSIFLEYVPGGSIGSCLQKHGAFDEDVTKSFMSQILGGLEYLHSRNILHRDLKADNILVETSGTCKISDFGISKRTDDINAGAFTAMQGTVFWMAPEVINPQKKGYNFKIDIWSVGCVILEMWAGSRPWLGNETFAVMFKLYEAKMPPPIPDGLVLSPLADDFRLQCFAINPEERPTATQLRKHSYLTLPPGWVFNGFK